CSALVACLFAPRRSVPRDNQHCPRGASEHTFSERTVSKTLPAAPPVRAKDNEIGFPRIGMQHDHLRRIAMLFDGANQNTFALRAFPQAAQQFDAFALTPGER